MSPDDPCPTTARKVAILAVVVVHERDLGEVEAWPVLHTDLATGNPQLAHVLIYDNSTVPRAQPTSEMQRCSYVHDVDNGATAAAYGCAAQLAESLGCSWVLLLDHDTRLTARYLLQVHAAIASPEAAAARALLPWIVHDAHVVSPARVTWAGSIRPLRRGLLVEPHWRLTGIASGSLIRTSAVSLLRPLLQESWLDYVDHRMFASLGDQRGALVVFEASLEHDLSVVNPGELSRERLRSILAGEARFIRGLPWPARVIYPLRLLARAWRLAWVRPSLAATVLARAAGIGS